ncbi:MAG: protein TolR [Hyphomicrobiales bacterium]
MAMSMNSGGSGSGRQRRQSYVPMAEINVTPFVDVMLVLLIVFMVAAPLLTVGVPVELPETKAKPLPSDKDPLAITVKAEGTLLLQETEIELDKLVPKLIEISKNNNEVRIYVRGDRRAEYGTVAKVMALINQAGFTKVALVTEFEDDT